MNTPILLQPPTLFEQAVTAYRSNDFDGAENLLQQFLKESVGEPEASHLLALVMRAKGQKHESVKLLETVVMSLDTDAEVWSNFGAVLRETGELQRSVEALGKSLELSACNPVALNNLGSTYLDLGRVDDAMFCFHRSMELNPRYCEAQTNLAKCYLDRGEIDKARSLAKAAVALDPSNSDAQNNLSFVYAALGDVDGCLNAVTNAKNLAPNNSMLWSNCLLRSLSSDSVTASDVRESADQWGARFEGVPAMRQPARTTLRKIGFVSGDFREHPVGRFVAPFFERLSRDLEVVCYSTSPIQNRMTARIESTVSKFEVFHRTLSEDFARSISDDNVDVLVDLSGHTGHNRLDVFSHRPAPHQVTWLGYSGTTGLPQMDSIVADDVLVSPEEDHDYSEQVLRLSNSFLCVEPVDFVRQNQKEKVVFGVFNNPSKFSRASFRLWAEVLKTCSSYKILFKYQYSGSPCVQRQIVARLCEHGVSPEQISFAPFAAFEEHLHIVSSVTVALDTYPYSGATTTIDCLTAGVPVVTLMGDRYSSRMTASLLTAVGQPQLIATSESDYVRIAVEQASNPVSGLRDRFLSSPLCDCERFTRDFLETLNQ